MVVSAKRDEIIIVKPPAEVCRQRNNVVYRKPISADKPTRKANPAAMKVAVEDSRRLALPGSGISEFVSLGITHAGEVPDRLAAPLMYLVAYGAKVLHGSPRFVA